MTDTHQLAYFAPLLAWHEPLWQRLTTQQQLPHAILASGKKGIGKRAFVWRWVAWQLCQQKQSQQNQAQSACGQCESCRLLASGNHNDLYVLPRQSLPTFDNNQQNSDSKTSKKSDKQPSTTIKIDDIRAIQNFVNKSSQNMRICVFDCAEDMTVSASNALLKTLEEPRQGVQLILITDNPTLLLPTIASRVQTLPLSYIDHDLAYNYLLSHISDERFNTPQAIKQLLLLSDYAPLQAEMMAQSNWYHKRELWLKSYNALQKGTRTATVASDYWQTELSLAEFIQLTQIMLIDLQRLACGLPAHQQDIDFGIIAPQHLPTISDISSLLAQLQKIDQSCKQNVQERLAYDMLMQSL